VIRLHKNIAVLLLGIFIFPITFQSFHIVWHQSHGYRSNLKWYHAEITKRPSQTDLKTAQQKDQPCSICEYQFSINDLPELTIFRSITPVIESSLNELEIQLPFQQTFSIKSPRAPPAIYS
jgi:hypothetical protein